MGGDLRRDLSALGMAMARSRSAGHMPSYEEALLLMASASGIEEGDKEDEDDAAEEDANDAEEPEAKADVATATPVKRDEQKGSEKPPQPPAASAHEKKEQQQPQQQPHAAADAKSDGETRPHVLHAVRVEEADDASSHESPVKSAAAQAELEAEAASAGSR
jgi:hypothetical protein